MKNWTTLKQLGYYILKKIQTRKTILYALANFQNILDSSVLQNYLFHKTLYNITIKNIYKQSIEISNQYKFENLLNIGILY